MDGLFRVGPPSIVFGDALGVLTFENNQLVFTGNVDESAKILFDSVASQFNQHLQQVLAAEREACAEKKPMK